MPKRTDLSHVLVIGSGPIVIGQACEFDYSGTQAGREVPRSRVCHSMNEVRSTVDSLGLPVVIRPSFTMGGLGSGMAHTPEDLERLPGAGLAASPIHEVLVEESVLGWKEYELELMRDRHDNVVVVCSI